jgi:RNA polymerase sigma-70 factor, ECF subfamily
MDIPGSDEEVTEALRLARAGDESGFRFLWQQLQPRLLRFLRVYGCAEPEDVASETWLHAIRDLHRFSGDADDFRGWLFSIARHRAIDATRSRARFIDRLLRQHFVREEDHKPAEAEVLAALTTREAIKLVAALPPDQRDAVALRVIAGLDTEAAASILRKSPGSVRVALHRGLKALARNPQVAALEEVDQ